MTYLRLTCKHPENPFHFYSYLNFGHILLFNEYWSIRQKNIICSNTVGSLRFHFSIKHLAGQVISSAYLNQFPAPVKGHL